MPRRLVQFFGPTRCARFCVAHYKRFYPLGEPPRCATVTFSAVGARFSSGWRHGASGQSTRRENSGAQFLNKSGKREQARSRIPRYM
jgi:hypothetical protein